MDPIENIRWTEVHVSYPAKGRFKVRIEGLCTLHSYTECIDTKKSPFAEVSRIDDYRMRKILETVLESYKQ